jgi:Holliday junction resolvase RusA-like endonuclease
MTATVMLSLPFPISTNALYSRGRGRVFRSKRYQSWIREAGTQLRAQRPGSIAGPVNVKVDLVAPDRRVRDADNTMKCVMDLLVAHRVIEADDSSIVRWVHPEWQDEGPPCLVTITACARPNPQSPEEMTR